MAAPNKIGIVVPKSDNNWLSTKQTAHFCGLSSSAIEKHRVYGGGPTFYKMGGKVLYKRTDLEVWLEDHRVTGGHHHG